MTGADVTARPRKGPGGPSVLTSPAYRARVARVRARLDAAEITQRAAAAEIGRSETHVYDVLRLARSGRPTLAKIEDLLDGIDAALAGDGR